MEESSKFFQTSICKILYPYAVESARRGKYTGAEELLRFILNHDSSPEYLLLLGKVYAQQAKYQEAIAEWKRVIEIDPDNQEARAAIQRAEELMKTILSSQVFRRRMATGILCVLLLISLGVNFSLWKTKKDVIAQLEDSLRDNQDLVVKYQEIEKRYKTLKEELDVSKKAKKALAQNGLLNFNITIKQKDRRIWIQGDVPTQYLKELIGEVVKQIEGVESVDITDVEVSHKYTVLPGDNLGKIAETLYGEYERWMEIFEANQSKIKVPHMILPGISLYIP